MLQNQNEIRVFQFANGFISEMENSAAAAKCLNRCKVGSLEKLHMKWKILNHSTGYFQLNVRSRYLLYM